MSEKEEFLNVKPILCSCHKLPLEFPSKRKFINGVWVWVCDRKVTKVVQKGSSVRMVVE